MGWETKIRVDLSHTMNINDVVKLLLLDLAGVLAENHFGLLVVNFLSRAILIRVNYVEQGSSILFFCLT